MRLNLSSRNPRDSVYSTENGQVLYKIDKSKSSVTCLRKALNDGEFALYAQVEFHTFKPTVFRFNGMDVPIDKFFRKDGWWNPKPVFKAADGREYYWRVEGSHLKMFRKDESKQQVAKFWEGKSSFGRFIKGRPALLEVDDSCAPILDEILMTFVYFQKQRQNNNRQELGGAGIEIGAAVISAT